MLEGLDDEWRRDVVRKVGDELRRRWGELVDVHAEGVVPDQRDIRPFAECFAQRRLQRAVDLDRMDKTNAIGEVPREHSQAGTDLENDIDALEIAHAPDDTEDVLVDEEVLTE